MKIKDKHGEWQDSPFTKSKKEKIENSKKNKGKATTKAELEARVKELEEILGI